MCDRFEPTIGDDLENEPLCPSVVCMPGLCDEEGPAKGLESCVGAWLSLRASSSSARCSSALLRMAASCASCRPRALSALTRSVLGRFGWSISSKEDDDVGVLPEECSGVGRLEGCSCSARTEECCLERFMLLLVLPPA